MGHFWESFSTDGANWSTPQPNDIISSDSPAGLVRLSDGRIVLLWNNSLRYPYAYGGRQILHAAISDDNAHTWRGHREVGRDPLRNELPSNEGDYGTAYPMPALANRDRVLFVSGQGRGRVLRLNMDPRWLVETKQSADFAARAEDWSTFGTKGVAVVPHPTKPGARVLSLRKTHADWPATAVWNFPSGAAGRLRTRVMPRIGFTGALVGLTDRSTPVDFRFSIYFSRFPTEPLRRRDLGKLAEAVAEEDSLREVIALVAALPVHPYVFDTQPSAVTSIPHDVQYACVVYRVLGEARL